MDLDSYVGRVAYCLGLRALEEGVRTISQAELAHRVEQLTKSPTRQSHVTRWLAGSWPREFEAQVAFAEVLGADPGWLYYGPKHSKAPPPTPSNLVFVSAEENARKGAGEVPRRQRA